MKGRLRFYPEFGLRKYTEVGVVAEADEMAKLGWRVLSITPDNRGWWVVYTPNPDSLMGAVDFGRAVELALKARRVK